MIPLKSDVFILLILLDLFEACREEFIISYRCKGMLGAASASLSNEGAGTENYANGMQNLEVSGNLCELHAPAWMSAASNTHRYECRTHRLPTSAVRQWP